MVTCPRPPVFAQPNKYSLCFSLHRQRLLSWLTVTYFTPPGGGRETTAGSNAPGAFLVPYWATTWRSGDSESVAVLKFESRTRPQTCTRSDWTEGRYLLRQIHILVLKINKYSVYLYICCLKSRLHFIKKKKFNLFFCQDTKTLEENLKLQKEKQEKVREHL